MPLKYFCLNGREKHMIILKTKIVHTDNSSLTFRNYLSNKHILLVSSKCYVDGNMVSAVANNDFDLERTLFSEPSKQKLAILSNYCDFNKW